MQSTNHHGVFQAHYTIITLLLVTKKQKRLFRDSNNCKINTYPSSSPKTGKKITQQKNQNNTSSTCPSLKMQSDAKFPTDSYLFTLNSR